jgi:hypothetical protein
MVIARVNKVKVENYSKETVNVAIQTCIEADNLIRKAGTVTANREILIQAVETYQEALLIYSRIPEPYIGIAYISYIAGEIKDAIGFINLALSIDPKNPKALEMLDYYQNELITGTKSPLGYL